MKKVRIARAAARQNVAPKGSAINPIIARITGALCLIALIGTISLVTAREGKTTTAAPVPVTVNGTALVSDVDNGARQPFGKRFFPSAGSSATFTVPAGKRLVITDVAGFAFGSTTVEDIAVFTTINGAGTARTIPFTVNNHGIVYAGAQISDYADPGSTVVVAIDDTNNADSAGMNVDIHGYYVNVP